ncbi:glycoside hydrolase family 105 protein [Paenibacillus sp. GCM10027626]|uniref:glycoside hydrolase family 88/105 protein n=1 Tax=Paenibacillus sp. GCM10027626 TaxID=3273411 RepID=UPI003635D9C1
MTNQLAQAADQVWQQMKTDHSGNWGMDIHQWDWVPGVGVIAMLEYGMQLQQAEGRTDVLDYLQQWVKQNEGKAAAARVINGIAPYAIFPGLNRVSGEEAYRKKAIMIAEWLMKEAPRTREQAFEHTVTENVEFAEQVWADTIFMAVLHLARTAALTGNVEFAEEAQRQVLIHLRLLEDKDSGVLYHGWNCSTKDHMSAARWTRANAWIAAGVPLIAQEISGLVAVEAELRERYVRLMDGLVRYQQADGLWSTVMDQPEFYREISGSAGIAYGLLKAMEGGLLKRDERYEAAAQRALQAILPYIDENGLVGGVSGGTPVMESIAAYNNIPLYPTLYGQGLVLMLLLQQLS